MRDKILCKAARRWEQELPRWEGKIIFPDGKVEYSGVLRTVPVKALQDAKRMREELLVGIR